jgi:hypothetical protein
MILQSIEIWSSPTLSFFFDNNFVGSFFIIWRISWLIKTFFKATSSFHQFFIKKELCWCMSYQWLIYHLIKSLLSNLENLLKNCFAFHFKKLQLERWKWIFAYLLFTHQQVFKHFVIKHHHMHFYLLYLTLKHLELFKFR